MHVKYMLSLSVSDKPVPTNPMLVVANTNMSVGTVRGGDEIVRTPTLSLS